MKIFPPSEVRLRNKSNGTLLTGEEALDVFRQAFDTLVARFFKGVNRHAFCGVACEFTNAGARLVPSFDGIGCPQYSCEFTKSVSNLNDIETPIVSKAARAIVEAIAKAKTDDETMAIILQNARLEIGSIGSRVTNRDTSYEIYFLNVPTAFLRERLSKVVNIVNKDHRNDEWEFGFVLTHAAEVAQFMDSIGRKQVFIDAVAEMKAFDEQNHLKKIYDDNCGRVPDREMTKIARIALVA